MANAMRRLEGAYSIVALSEGRLDRLPRRARLPPARDRTHSGGLGLRLRDVRARPGRRRARPRGRAGRARHRRRRRPARDAGTRTARVRRALHLGVLLPRPTRQPARGHGGAQRAGADGRAARARGAGRGRPRAADPRLRHARGDRLRPRARAPVQRGADQEPLRPAHVHPARPGAAPAGDQAQVPPGRRGRGEARGRGRRLDRPRQHDPRDRADAVRRGRGRGASPRLVAAGGRAVLLRDRPRRPVGDDRFHAQRRGGAGARRRHLARLPLARRPRRSDAAAGVGFVPRAASPATTRPRFRTRPRSCGSRQRGPSRPGLVPRARSGSLRGRCPSRSFRSRVPSAPRRRRRRRAAARAWPRGRSRGS